jgi:glutathione S-transferase
MYRRISIWLGQHTNAQASASGANTMSQTSYRLVIGNKAWSSWSMRPWLVLTHAGLAFDEIHVPLRTSGTADAIAAHSPSGKVPALIDGDLVIWDSLAIIEYLADAHPGLGIWPQDRRARAIARAVSAEMHSGFQALRQNCPMDITARGLQPADAAAIQGDCARIVAIWRDCRARFGGAGPFLFSQFSAADAMFAPVVSRFVTYGIDPAAHGCDGVCARYMAAVSGHPAYAKWAHDAQELSQG